METDPKGVSTLVMKIRLKSRCISFLEGTGDWTQGITQGKQELWHWVPPAGNQLLWILIWSDPKCWTTPVYFKKNLCCSSALSPAFLLLSISWGLQGSIGCEHSILRVRRLSFISTAPGRSVSSSLGDGWQERLWNVNEIICSKTVPGTY